MVRPPKNLHGQGNKSVQYVYTSILLLDYQHGWRPPEDGLVKINTYGAINVAEAKGEARGVARSVHRLLGVWSKPLPGITDPLIAECMALRDGVLFARLQGLTHVIIETDCLRLLISETVATIPFQLWLLFC
jgi:hypothetical protein